LGDVVNGHTNGKSVLRFRVDIVVEPDAGAFHAFAPALKGLHVEGRTEDEAIKNATDAAKAYIRSLIKHGKPIPISAHDMPSGNGNGVDHEGTHAHPQEFALT
jgi:predicted RNase H-like HicB family nuclease